MKILKLSTTAVLIAASVFTASIASAKTADTITPEKLLNSQTQMSVIWMQQSGEYEAIARQTFGLAKRAFDESQVTEGQKKAVVTDLDETMISNAAEAAWQAKTGKSYSSKDWARWVEAREATAIAGAVEFAKYVNSNGGQMFYVSNRKVAGLQATIDNLKALGFPGVSEETVLLKDKSSKKVARFDKVRAKGYDIVVFLGDNLNDFTNDIYHKSNAERRAFVQNNEELFGTKYIVLPNANYGGWVGGMAPDYFKNDTQGKLKIHDEAMTIWDGK